jgi:processive 1,2-diacylglycerol beta-glucosyltransferase
MVMGGGFGLHLTGKIIRQIDASPELFSLQVIAGRNAAFQESLEGRRATFRHPLTVLGFVNDMPDRLRKADVLVTKPGGMTSAEALALGVPMVLLPPLPGQERYNRDYLVGSGAALSAPGDDVGDQVTRLLADPSLAAGLRRRMSALARPQAAGEIARYVLDRLAKPAEAPERAAAGAEKVPA